jgi:signal transduction histidine kinase
LLAGVAMLIAGLASLASQTGGIGAVGASASAIAVVIGGLAMFGAPALGRLVGDLDEERSMRIREDELARVSAHLHDSVLQSLVLIQRSDDPRRMANLARRQERELRAWLYGDVPVGEPTTLHAAIEALTTEIENDHDTRVEAVIVGDQPLDDAARTLLAALREAIVNSAQHADVDRIDVFVEADDAELTGFVRDTGNGFDPAAIPTGHRGISDSIIGRVERVGGTATITSHAGIGTEVELCVPRRRQ